MAKEHLDPKARWSMFIGILIGVLFIILVLSMFIFPIFGIIFGIASFVIGELTSPLISIVLFILALVVPLVVAVVAAYFWSGWTYDNYMYELTEDGIRIERGVILKKYSTIPYERVQNVDISMGVIERLLDIVSLDIQTAGYSYTRYGQTAEGRLPGLDSKRAEQLRDLIIQKMKGKKGM